MTEHTTFAFNPSLTNESLNALFASAWSGDWNRDFKPVLERSMGYVCAYHAMRLIGFVNLVWDGSIHVYVSEVVVHAAFQKQGIGTNLVRQAIELAKQQEEVQWIHVDYEPHLEDFYQGCGFRSSHAGILRLR